MEREEITKRVKDVIASTLLMDSSQIGDDCKIQSSLDVDSMDNVEIIMNLEHEFNIRISDADAYKYEDAKVSEIVDYIINRLS